ncbi:C47 family peptidase [Lactococcus sp. NH2-7C]|uniref:C47 family peptidase n=1 Tax=Lactococcus sp. NH2-7C TaxID=2879149 RepID=UPI001CDCECCB|nr:C47 family peptidase [Lactococcus sp. NH2-7C]MCA2390129.1 transglutaminase [Lactococcus sp. NH2-7C]WGV29609.1 C47 family peptidase [Lactococcus sp. NH2-7C]
MKVKWKPIQCLVSLGVGLLLFSSIAPSAAAFTVQQSVSNEDNVSVNIKQIDNFKNLFSNLSAVPSNSLAQTLVSVLSHDKLGDSGNFTVNASIQDILRFTYPNATNQQLNGLTINGEQAVKWLNHVGYTATLVNRPLTTDEIKQQLDDSDPIIPILTNQNNDAWLNESVAGVLYAHDDVEAGTEKLHKSFIESVGLGEAMVQDGQEAQPITFPEQSNVIDPIQAGGTYLWAQTIMNIKQDPSVNNVKTLNTNTKNGVFASKVTTSGTYSQVEFTEPLLSGLKNKVPDSPQITASAQVQNKGWLPESKNGEPIGTEGQGLRMEAFKVALSHLPAGETGGIAYSAHVQGIGWQNDVANGGIAGTVGKGLRVEAIKMHLTGSLAEHYSIYYATQVQNIGWTPYVKDGEISGTTGKSLRVETISIRLVKKKLQKTPSDETKRSAVALVNLYEDANHQKTVADLESFAGVAPTDAITSKHIMDWYHFLGLEFDTQNGRFSPDKAKNLSKTGRLYYTFLKAKTAPDNIQNFGAIGMGYMENSMSYSPYLSYLNEDFAPSAFWSQRKNELLGQMNERMKTYDYDNVFTLDEQGKQLSEYEEEVTLYNIRAKESTETANVNPPENSPSSPATPVNAINASYHPLSYFNITETQGSEPWCSEYVAAAEINTLNQVNGSSPQDSRVTAQNLMQAYYPGISLDQLKTMSGGTIENALQALQSKYQVTADVENRALSFDEVKKELDAGQTIQIDVNDPEETAPQGSADNAGHSLAIVGYVLPADGDTTKHAPYYEVWNPWWEKTFYVSSKAPYFNLAGTQYKWTRTWHNWRKVAGETNTKTSPAIAQQKVASSANPEAVKVKTLTRLTPKVQLYNPTTPNPTDYLFKDSPLPQSNVLSQIVSQLGQETTLSTVFSGDCYGYASRNGQFRARKNNYKKPIVSSNNSGAKDFKNAILSTITDRNKIAAFVVSAAVVMMVVAILGAIPVVNLAVPVALHALETVVGVEAARDLIWTCVDYRTDFDQVEKSFDRI